MAAHDYPLRSGAREQGIRRGTGVQKAAIEQAPEDVLALPAAIEPVAVLVGVGLQVARADAVEDVKRPALEVGEHDVRCLLYTSDAADDLLCVDLGGRRIIKKKNKKKSTAH